MFFSGLRLIFPSLQSAAAQAALQAAQALAGQTETQGGPNTVLRVIVEHMVYPVTLDVLFQVSNIDVFFPLLWFLSSRLEPSGGDSRSRLRPTGKTIEACLSIRVNKLKTINTREPGEELRPARTLPADDVRGNRKPADGRES